jgi:CheY-like chemotaxis protein
MPYGHILIVDDVESNLFVAKGLMEPYKLKLETVTSGPDAITKIKSGLSYDIIFMDHMMPNMDGIEAAKIIRSHGFKNAIVALTANAVVGQADIFLACGFDGFISKPIDIRELNVILKKFVRDKYPAEVVEAALKENVDEDSKNSGENKTGTPPLNPELARIFLGETSRTIALIEQLCEKGGACTDEDIKNYVVTIHGTKGSLANIGELELYGVAAKLEQAGRDKNKTLIFGETPAFLESLRTLAKKLTPPEKENANEEINDDLPYLREKLLAIKTACSEYATGTAKKTIAELRQKAWSKRFEEPLIRISECLLHSDFDEAISVAESVMKMT